MSNSFLSVVDAFAPRALRSSVMLLPCRLGAEPLTSAAPWKVLPPDLGMAFMIGPLVPVSPLCPESWTSTWSKSSGERLMFVRFELKYMLPMRRPSNSDTPSPVTLPCAWTVAPV